ncbi:uncharacterized protein LOC108906415 [Anoplophora glabripennis]|uniref:uncharacterized protein LOC108906415 n=1 Tax=Anoplophora glabripennis TaxID=217634 RepID=UPI0008737AEE|nr:uncharacterized protein LOC108906415 [Anoplophora glabripennis]
MSFLSKVCHIVNITRLLRSYSAPKRDPGINLRKKALNLDAEIDEIEFDDLETDFMNVHKTHREHVSEIEAGLEKEKFHIVRQKYFKEKQLNFLTWYDKDQIKYLHSTDPEEWTIEKLSESFPALPEVIKKIVKSKWTLNATRVSNHDRTVQKNWENFKSGQIKDLPEELVNHLNKFTNRALHFKPFEAPQTKNVVNVNTKRVGTEFSDIITSYNKLKAKKHHNSDEELTVNINTEILKSVSDSNNGINQRIKKRHLTLHELQNKLENRLNLGKDLPEDEKLMLKNLKQSSEVNPMEQNQNNFEDVMINKFETSKSTTLMKKKQQDYNHLIYPEKISIPKNLRKKGYTYKLNDCYYDDDGLFLYRVPGMY